MQKDWQTKQQGTILVDVLLATSIFALLVTAVVGAVYFGAESTATAGIRSRAVSIAEEGLEAARAIRDKGYANLTAGAHGLSISGNEWTFSGTSDSLDQFARSVTVTAIDTVTSSVVSTVTWTQAPWRAGSVSLTTYLTNWVLKFWAAPAQQASVDLSGANDGRKVQTQGNYAYVVRDGGTPDFAIIDISIPSTPSLVGSLSLSGNPTNLFVSGNYAYVSSTENTQELQVIDITSPSAPIQAGTFDAAGGANANGVYMSGSTVYLVRAASASQELHLVDVSVPTLPVLLGSFEIGADVNEVVTLGAYAYLATASNSEELRVVDVSVPAAPTGVGSLNLSGNTDALSITGTSSTIILGRADSLVYMIDVTTPTAPSTSGSLNVSGNVNDVALGNSNQYVYLVTPTGSTEFQVVDITTTTSPSSVGTLNMNGTKNGVAYAESLERALVVGSDNSEELVIVEPL